MSKDIIEPASGRWVILEPGARPVAEYPVAYRPTDLSAIELGGAIGNAVYCAQPLSQRWLNVFAPSDGSPILGVIAAWAPSSIDQVEENFWLAYFQLCRVVQMRICESFPTFSEMSWLKPVASVHTLAPERERFLKLSSAVQRGTPHWAMLLRTCALMGERL